MIMKSGGTHFRFGPFVLIPSEHALQRDARPVRLARKDFDLLVVLVERAGSLVRKEELQERLWPDAVVEEGNLTKHVSTLRKALGDSEGAGRFIETVPRVGFRFVAPVEQVDGLPVVAASGERTARSGATRAIAPAAAIVIALVSLGVGFARLREPGANGSPAWQALAVLPFTTIGGQDADRLGLGLTDAIITRLSAQTLIRVRPTSAIRGYATGARPDIAAVAGALQVDVVLDGHIQRAGDLVRVTVQLTDARKASPVWAETFDQPAGELFRLEDAIAERVAGALRLRLAAADQERLKRRYTSNGAAYVAYLNGRAALLRYTPEGTREAIGAFERALTLDPAYTLARAGLAMGSADMYLRFAPESEVQAWGDRAEREARRAIDLDPDLAEAHLARAAVFRKREFDWDQTIGASRRALVLNPNLDQAHFFAAAAFYHMGMMERSLAEMEQGRRVGGGDRMEPLRIEGLVALFSADFATARVRLEELSRLSSRPIADTYLALVHYYSGDAARGRSMLEQLAGERSASTSTRSRAALASVLAAAGDRASARGLLGQVIAGEYRDHHVAYSVGVTFAQLGERDTAVTWLRQAAATGFPCLPWYSRDPLLAPLKGDPAFTAFLAELEARRDVALARFAHD
jgi:DNA-binding winged helix-turn-helix (wHTH) protein/TolB-like protein